MTEPKTKKLSRRDALKILAAAAGASVLANLPSKWTKPELATGVLPAHAQTSACYAVILEVLSNNGTLIYSTAQGPNPNPSFTGVAGSTVYWNCQSGCLEVVMFLSSGTSASVRITTYNHSSFILNFDNQFNGSHDVLIDMATGKYGVDSAPAPVGPCNWVPQ